MGAIGRFGFPVRNPELLLQAQVFGDQQRPRPESRQNGPDEKAKHPATAAGILAIDCTVTNKGTVTASGPGSLRFFAQIGAGLEQSVLRVNLKVSCQQ
jgi:hypothetical protein